MYAQKFRWLALRKLRRTDHQRGKVFADDPSGIIQEFQESPKIGTVRLTGSCRKGGKKFRQERINLFNADGSQFDVLSFKVIMKSEKDPSDIYKPD